MSKHLTHTFALFAAALVTTFLPHASAITMDFEVPENYEPGKPLVGQPQDGVRWQGSSSLCEVVDTEGVGGGQCMKLDTPGGYATVYYEPLPEDTGVTVDADGKVTGKVAFSLAVKTTLLKDGSFEVPLRVRVGLDGEACPVRIHCYAGGKIEFFEEGKAVRAKTAEGDDVYLREGVFTTISGVIDFSAGTYSISVDKVPQTGAAGENIAFNKTEPRQGFGRLELTNSSAGEGAIFLDEVTLQPAK